MPLTGVSPTLSGNQEPVRLASAIMRPFDKPAISGCWKLAVIVRMPE